MKDKTCQRLLMTGFVLRKFHAGMYPYFPVSQKRRE